MEYRDLDLILTDHARRWGARVYVESIAQQARLTFAAFDAACNRVAHLLAERGLRANERVSVLSGNCLELLILFFGVQRYGATVNPIDVEVNVKNVAQILHDVEPRLVFWNRAIAADLQAVVHAAGGEAVPFGSLSAAAPPDDLLVLLADYPASPCRQRVGAPHDMAIIDYTSGTTAKPKGVCISHAAYYHMCDAVVERLGLTAADRLLEYRSLGWESPQILTLGPTLHTGAGLVIAPRFSSSQFFHWLRDYRITIAAGVPTVIYMLLEQPAAASGDELPSFRFLTSSTAPLAVEKQREFESRYRLRIVQLCGMTEAGFMAGNRPQALRPGSIGQAMRHVRARFLDESGAECAVGQEGEMVVSGPQMASAYLTDRGTLVPIPQDGFRTGDIGYQDAEGFLYLTGRKKDLIIRGGVNIAPAEISRVLLEHDAVAEAATIGVPDELYGEGVVSFVVPRAGQRLNADDLHAHCRTRLSAFKHPQQILVLDALPKNERGKIAPDGLLSIWRHHPH